RLGDGVFHGQQPALRPESLESLLGQAGAKLTLDLVGHGSGVRLQVQAKVFTQAVCLTEELCGRLEELSGNRDGTTAHEGVSDVFLPTQLGGSCQCFSKAAMRTDDPVAQFGERKIAQVVGYRSLQTNLLRDAGPTRAPGGRGRNHADPSRATRDCGATTAARSHPPAARGSTWPVRGERAP